MKYKVIWFDDKHESLEQIKREALGHNIELVGFRSYESGMKEIESNYDQYSAVLLDARFFINENQSSGTEDLEAFEETQKFINGFQQKKFKYFILTGQANLKKGSSFHEQHKNLFEKGDPDSMDDLWNKLVLACQEDKDHQVRVEYQKVFDSLKVMSRIKSDEILKIIRSYNTLEKVDAPQDLATLRTILERIIEHYNDKGYLPEPVYIKGLNSSIRFLSGNDYLYKLEYELFNPTIAIMATYLNKVLQDATHMKDIINLKVKEHLNDLNSRYFYKSCVNQLFEIMIYTKYFFDKEVKPGNWDIIRTNENHIKGILMKDADGHYYCHNCKVYPNYKGEKIVEGTKILITQTVPNTDDKTNSKYPLFARRLIKQ